MFKSTIDVREVAGPSGLNPLESGLSVQIVLTAGFQRRCIFAKLFLILDCVGFCSKSSQIGYFLFFDLRGLRIPNACKALFCRYSYFKKSS